MVPEGILQLLDRFDEHKAMTQEDVAEVAGVSVRTVAKWRWTHRGPAFFRIGQRAHYLRKDVESWLNSLYVKENGRPRVTAAA